MLTGETVLYKAGVDEVGRGCLAGPVIAAAVILNPEARINGLKDSKKLTSNQRNSLAIQIRSQALAWSIGRAEASEIDAMNILNASLLAMTRACTGLPVKPGWIQVDGNRYPPMDIPGECIIHGDDLVTEISAASIMAKVARDEEMQFLDLLYPGYGFSRHKGYPTKEHKALLNELGPCPVHRRSFQPVALLFSHGA